MSRIGHWLGRFLGQPTERDAERAAAADAATVQWASRTLPDLHPIEQASLLTNLDQGGLSVPGYEAPDTDEYRQWAYWNAGGIINSASYARYWAETLTDPADQRQWDPEPAWPDYYGGLDSRAKDKAAVQTAADDALAAAEDPDEEHRRELEEEAEYHEYWGNLTRDQFAQGFLRDEAIQASQDRRDATPDEPVLEDEL